MIIRFPCSNVTLTLILTLKIKNDIIYLLYYVYDIHASKNITITCTHSLSRYDKWRGTSISLWRPYRNSSENSRPIPIEKMFGDVLHDIYYILNYLCTFDTCVQVGNTSAICEGLPTPLFCAAQWP